MKMKMMDLFSLIESPKKKEKEPRTWKDGPGLNGDSWTLELWAELILLKENAITSRESYMLAEKDLELTCASKMMEHHMFYSEKPLEMLLKNRRSLLFLNLMLKNGTSYILAMMPTEMSQLELLNLDLDRKKSLSSPVKIGPDLMNNQVLSCQELMVPEKNSTENSLTPNWFMIEMTWTSKTLMICWMLWTK